MAEAKKGSMGFWSCTALVVGNMVGSGVFLLPSSLAAFGGLSLFGWLVSSTGAVILAFTFARLARLNPSAGGPYAYTRDGFGSFAGYLCAWTYWKAAWIGNAAIAVTLVGYLRVFIPALADPLLMVATAIGAIWLCTLINLRGITAFAVVQNCLTALKLIPLLLVGILGWFHFNPDYLTIPAPSELPNMGYAQAIATTAALTLWSFIGLESATVPADDVRDPKKTIPRATLFGTLAAAAVYILSITAVQGLMPPEVLAKSTSPFADAARILLGTWGYYLVAGGAVIACLGALNGWVLLQGQIPVAPARDGLFPESLGKLNKNGAPANGLLSSGLLVTALVMVDGHGELVEVFNVIILLGTMTGVVPYAFCTAALIQMLAVKPESFSPRSRPQVLAIGCLGFLYSLWALYGTGQQAIFWGFLVFMAGIPMYTWRQYRNRAQGLPMAAGD
ncbi:amino acid permease [Pseudomonas sp. BGr12]|jgi:APA family basic amino acid/polyamine antiporter|uniref:amino acid permease n=1 Tax=unclassified Pseudomonas TaxID=196821 RepID=UPI0017868316|nr:MULTISPECIES: amino acid permease [unclassified Pseudomonas]MBD9503923.1 amino acid permease [Pseudomonas sp. PDM17]MBD9578578.1 amino acid permease [Pseudomonas sp. PDM23]MBD9674358.1 amino acid permease [Pseudomonas sp. PDM21]MDL2429459.1 amino acid permease [Pseudomonas sp. BJa5]